MPPTGPRRGEWSGSAAAAAAPPTCGSDSRCPAPGFDRAARWRGPGGRSAPGLRLGPRLLWGGALSGLHTSPYRSAPRLEHTPFPFPTEWGRRKRGPRTAPGVLAPPPGFLGAGLTPRAPLVAEAGWASGHSGSPSDRLGTPLAPDEAGTSRGLEHTAFALPLVTIACTCVPLPPPVGLWNPSLAHI